MSSSKQKSEYHERSRKLRILRKIELLKDQYPGIVANPERFQQLMQELRSSVEGGSIDKQRENEYMFDLCKMLRGVSGD